MIVGIDSGTSLTKFAWASQDGIQLRSTATSTKEEIYSELLSEGIQKARVIGTQPIAHPFQELPRRNPDPIREETTLQARGAAHLAEINRHCLVVSIGTGVTYTRMLWNRPIQMPIGNSLGGGYLDGMKKIADSMWWRRNLNWEEFDQLASTVAPDILVGDFYPDHVAKDLVLANFGKFQGKHASICSGAVSVVATTIAKDLILYAFLTRDVVFVGTAAQLRSLQDALGKWQPTLNKQFHFPEQGAFAGAVGAMKHG